MRFRIAEGRQEEWEALVAQRSVQAKATKGFQKMYLLRPESGESEYRVVTWWKDALDHEAWIRSERYAFSEDPDHLGIVAGPVTHEVLRVVGEF